MQLPDPAEPGVASGANQLREAVAKALRPYVAGTRLAGAVAVADTETLVTRLADLMLDA